LKLSIITAAYNSKDTIEDCLKSVASQTYDNVEHIIVDGGSTDGTREAIQSALGGQKCIVVSEPDEGIYDALNK
jgi:glycosyltransferase